HNPTAVAAAVEHIRQRTAQGEVIRGWFIAGFNAGVQ
ncbi:hypothetical protein ONQ87_24525, partial [Salmonella enterica subsp. enterica serovar Virginia]|nr:hypothetical protein [Salmonella enterica subsp. enterica serovar Virginia]